MELYLFRHGIAVDRSLGMPDSERPLTPKGERKTRLVAQHLWQMDLSFEAIATSPYLRAKQTADILYSEKLGDRPITLPELKPDGSFQAGVKWLKTWQKKYSTKTCLILVGHQPNLGHWAEQLLWGKIGDRLILKKAGLIGIHLDSLEKAIPNHELFLLTSPKWML